MNRLFSMIRRRPNYIDIITPILASVDGYRLKWAQNFDGAFTTILTSTRVGYVDPAINPNVIDAQNTANRNVRIVFNPASYGITDTSSFWLQFVPVTGGVEGTAGAPTLVLPDSANHGVGIVTIHGNAPNAAGSTGSLQLDLPRLSHDFRIHNEDATNALYVATEQNGAETQLQPDTFSQFSTIAGTQGSIWVRGGGATVAFSATFTLAFPR